MPQAPSFDRGTDGIRPDRRPAARSRPQGMLDQRDGEIRHADVSREPVALDLAQRADGFGERHVRIGPVQQQQIDLAEPQPRQAIARRALQLARREMTGPDFGGDEHVAALDAGRAQTFTDFALVVIHLGGVDVPVAEPQRLLDDARAGAAAQFPGAEADQRNPCAVCFDARDWFEFAHLTPAGSGKARTISSRFAGPASARRKVSAIVCRPAP